MKRNFYTLGLTVAILLALFVSACTKSASLSPDGLDGELTTLKVAKLRANAPPEFTKSQKALTEELTKRVPQIRNIGNHAIEKSGQYYYWTARGTDPNNATITIAVELVEFVYSNNGDDLYIGGSQTTTTYTCSTLKGCNGCDFVTDGGSGKIIGCRCSLAPPASNGQCSFTTTVTITEK